MNNQRGVVSAIILALIFVLGGLGGIVVGKVAQYNQDHQKVSTK